MMNTSHVLFVITLNVHDASISAWSGGAMIWRSRLMYTGWDFIRALLQSLRSNHNLLVGERTAERAFIELGSALPVDELRTWLVRGRNLVSGFPTGIEISNMELSEIIEPLVTSFISQVQYIFDEPYNPDSTPRCVPDHLKPLLSKSPLFLTGSFRLKGLEQRLQDALGREVLVGDEWY